jgi:serine O-acetyltransferase
MSDTCQPFSVNSTFDWNLAEVVAELREIRADSLSAAGRSKRPVKLPSAAAITQFLDSLCAAMFPNRLGNRQLAAESVDYFVGFTLDRALHELVEQVRRELDLNSDNPLGRNDPEAIGLVQRFAREIPGIRRLIESDLRAAYENDPAAHTIDEVLICYPGVTATIYYRIAHVFHCLGVQLIARFISKLAQSITSIDIHPAARIGKSFFIDTGTGVVIGETAEIGERVRIYHGVTLGSNQLPLDDAGRLVKGTPRHPIVEDDVVIHSGATLVGRITVGKGSVISSKIWLNQSVPPGSLVLKSS